MSRPTYKQRSRFVIEASSTQKRYSNYNQYRDSQSYTLSTQLVFFSSSFFFLLMSREIIGKLSLPLSFCFIFLLDNHELMRQTQKGDNLNWICVQSVPGSIRANVFRVHPCTLSNGTCVTSTPRGALLLLENKSKSKQLPLVQEGNAIRFSHP